MLQAVGPAAAKAAEQLAQGNAERDRRLAEVERELKLAKAALARNKATKTAKPDWRGVREKIRKGKLRKPVKQVKVKVNVRKEQGKEKASKPDESKSSKPTAAEEALNFLRERYDRKKPDAACSSKPAPGKMRTPPRKRNTASVFSEAHRHRSSHRRSDDDTRRSSPYHRRSTAESLKPRTDRQH